MADSAEATYSVHKDNKGWMYSIQLQNTSTGLDAGWIYGFLFGYEFLEPELPKSPFGMGSSVNGPMGWTGMANLSGIEYETNFKGSPQASGYIGQGESGNFHFHSSFGPPTTIKFGCAYYHQDTNTWGPTVNGTAHQFSIPSHLINDCAIDPLALVFHSSLYQRIVEKLHPHVLREAFAGLTSEERSSVDARIEFLGNYLRNAKEALSATPAVRK